MAGDTAIVTLNPDASYPEGPLLLDGALYYAEMGRDRVMRWDGAANQPVWSRANCAPTSVARAREDGALIVLCHREGSLAKITPSGETLKIIDKDEAGKGFINPNASVNDARGGVYFSSSGIFSPTAPSEGAVLYLDKDEKLRRVAEGIHYANGVALSRDGARLYVSEHLSRRVLVFDVGGDGSLSGQRVFVALDDLVGADPNRIWEAGPDGLAVDRADNLYLAEYGGGRLLIVAPDGKLLATVAVPQPFVTAPALSANEERIFITAPGLRLPPYSGKVYSLANPVHRKD